MRLRRLAELSGSECVVLLQLLPLAALTKLALRRVPVNSVMTHLERLARPRLGLPLFARGIDEQHVYTLADWAMRPSAGKTPCLIRSLMLQMILQRRGERPLIALGVMRNAAGIRSHAWVTVRGRPVGESETSLAGFTPIANLGSA